MPPICHQTNENSVSDFTGRRVTCGDVLPATPSSKIASIAQDGPFGNRNNGPDFFFTLHNVIPFAAMFGSQSVNRVFVPVYPLPWLVSNFRMTKRG